MKQSRAVTRITFPLVRERLETRMDSFGSSERVRWLALVAQGAVSTELTWMACKQGELQEHSVKQVQEETGSILNRWKPRTLLSQLPRLRLISTTHEEHSKVYTIFRARLSAQLEKKMVQRDVNAQSYSSELSTPTLPNLITSSLGTEAGKSI